MGSDIFIETKALRTLREELTISLVLNSRRARGRTGFIISGDFHTGKTTASLLTMRYYHHWLTAMHPKLDIEEQVPIVYVAVPGHATPKSLMKSFSWFFGIPVRPGDDATDLADRVADAMVVRKTSLVVVDEVQNLSRIGGPYGTQAAAVLKGLYEDALGTTFIFAGKNAPISPLLGGNEGEQIRSRSQLIRLENYSSAPEDRPDFLAAIQGFEKRLGLFAHEPGSLGKVSDYIFRRTGGNLGLLNELLTRAAAKAILTAKHPREERLTYSLLQLTNISERSALIRAQQGDHGRS